MRLGGACMFMEGPNSRRATATVHSSSPKGGSGAAAMAVPFLGTKFWTISSCQALQQTAVSHRHAFASLSTSTCLSHAAIVGVIASININHWIQIVSGMH